MGSYLNEAEAKTELEALIKATTTDYKLYVKNRLYKENLTKQVDFGLILLPENSEPIFNAIAKLKLSKCKDKILNLTSSIYLDERERTLKDLIIITTKVKI